LKHIGILKKKICFIINPNAGFGKHKKLEIIIKKYLNHSIFEYEILYTKAPGHATDLCKEAVEGHFDIVAISGGDGSINETATELIEQETIMAIIPTGSGNGLARHLNIPLKIPEAIKLINKFNVKTIDTGEIHFISNKSGQSKTKIFTGTASLGFDAHIASIISKFNTRTLWSYAKAILKEFSKYETKNYELEIDGKRLTRKVFSICFANSSQYGNNSIIAPKAIIDDGYLDICIVKKFPFYRLPFVVYRLFNRTIDKSSYLEIIKGKEIIIIQNSKLIQLDGEPINLGSRLHIKINPLSLKVIVP